MVTYRATPISQRDGSPLANANCRMAGIATGIDHHTTGAIRSTGAEMRARQSDQVGGTDSGDSAEAWRTYGQDLFIGDGSTFAAVLDALHAGRAVQLDVWHATTGGPCLSGSGEYGHDLAIAPEQSGDRWLVADPWCSPARYVWWPESRLRAGAEDLGAMTYTAATAGRYVPRTRRELIARMREQLRALFTLYTPATPALVRPSTSGAGGYVFWTATRAQGETTSPGKGEDVPINAYAGLVTDIRADVPAGLDFYGDADLTDRLGSMSKASTLIAVGNPIGELVEGGSRAVLVNTGSAYADGSTRPTIVYVAADAVRTYSVPPSSGSGDDDDAIALRDAEWREWLLDGAPGS